jgi:hypothetical protein
MRTLIKYFLLCKEKNQEIEEILVHDFIKIEIKKDSSIILTCIGVVLNPKNKKVLTWKGISVFTETKNITLKKYIRKLYKEWKKSKKSFDEFMDGKIIRYGDEITAGIKQFNLTLKQGSKNIDLLDEAGVIVFRGTKIEIKKYLKFRKLPLNERKIILEKAKQNIRANKDINPYDITRANAQKYNVPASKAGKSPNFFGLKMYLNKQGTLGKLGVKNLPKGLTKSQFDDALQKINKFGGEVRANITGVRGSDFANSWKAMGIDRTIGTKIAEHFKLTWHHLDDLDENLMSTMQLVLTKIHDATVPHVGSYAQMKEVINLIK